MILRILLFSACLASQSLFAQIQITADDITNLLGTTVMVDFDTSDQIAVDVGLPGADQTYLMDQPFAVPPALYTQSFITPDLAPNASDFPESNFVMKVDFEDDSVSADITSYAKVETDGWTQIGFVSRFAAEDIDTVLVQRRDEQIMPFPLTFGSTWSSASADTFEIIAGSALVMAGSTMHEVDGWGKIVLPSGTFDCLRIKQSSANSTQVTFNGVPITNTSSTSISYQWVNKANAVLASISSLNNETDPNFTVAESFARIRSATTGVVDHDALQDLTVAPNPITDHRLNVQLTTDQATELQIRLLTTSGAIATTLWKGHATQGENNFHLTIDPAVPNGIYPLEIITDLGKSVRQVLVVR